MAMTGSSTWRVLVAPLQQRRNQGTLWFMLLLAALALGGPTGIVLFLEHTIARTRGLEWAAYATILWSGVSALALGGWVLFANSVIVQNQSTSARLVPGHVRTLRRMLMAAWGVLTAIGSAGFVLLHFDAYVTVSLVAILLALVAVAARWPTTLILGGVFPLALATIDRAPWASQALQAWLALWRAAPLPITGIVLLAALATLQGLVQGGGTRHARADEARKARAARLRMRTRGLEATAPAGSIGVCMSARLRTGPYVWSLRRALAHPGRSTLTRVMLAFGPTSHWTGHVVNIAVMLAWIVVAVLLFSSLWNPAAGVGVFGGFAISAVFPFAAPALQAHARLYQTRREQALLMLLPDVPRGAALNRALSWRLSGTFALTWLIGLALVELATALLPPSPRGRPLVAFGDLSLLVAASLLPLLPTLWRRWSHLRAPTSMTTNLLFVVPVALSALGWVLEHEAGVPFAGVVALYAGATLGWCALRWHAMGREPSAFPVGRLAGAGRR